MTEVALLLGLRAVRRPVRGLLCGVNIELWRHQPGNASSQTGYWDNMDNLDQELTLFVAANWTRFPDPDTPGESYWYNQVRASIEKKLRIREDDGERSGIRAGVCVNTCML